MISTGQDDHTARKLFSDNVLDAVEQTINPDQEAENALIAESQKVIQQSSVKSGGAYAFLD